MLAQRHDTDRLSDDWLQWIAESKMLLVEDDEIIRQLVENGVQRGVAAEAIMLVTSSPGYRAGDKFAQRLRKIESLLGVYDSLSALAPAARSVPRKLGVTREQFFATYYSRNRPVVILGAMHGWPALTRWTPNYFKVRCGEAAVEVMAGRGCDPDYEVNAANHRHSVLFSDYIDSVQQFGNTNDVYMVANNHFLDGDAGRALYADIGGFPEYLSPEHSSGCVFFWFGPAGTVTPLHHDTMNVLLAQVLGRKLVTLISPNQSPLLYNDVGVYSRVDCQNPNYDEYPLFRAVRPIHLILLPGEALFIPVGWWHHVRALDVSVSVSFTNFAAPNDYDWSMPQIECW